MVVTKPPGENAQVLHKPKEGEKHPSPQGGSFGIVQSSADYDGKLYFNTCALFIVLKGNFTQFALSFVSLETQSYF
jgi:hypothetical protein